MTNSRFLQQHRLLEKLQNYWGSRAINQVRYLEELIKAGYWKEEALAEDITQFLADRFERQGAITADDVAILEDRLMPVRQTAKSIQVTCSGHAHIDMDWLWSYDESVIITIETFRTMLQLMREYPTFTFLQSQASVYRFIEQYAPEMLPEIRQRIAEGRWEVTASTWVEADKNMPNGESQTRHLLYTRQYLKKLLGLQNGDFQMDFEPDTFGHAAQVPEILQNGGVRYYYHCRGYDQHSLYRWEAPSGAQVIAVREHTWYNEVIDYNAFLYIPVYCKQYGIDRAAHIYGVGDHGGGVTRRDIERLLDMATWPCMPDITFGRLIDFFRYLETVELPVVKGELNFIFDGCYTTQTRLKKANRVSEAGLFKAETAGAFAQIYAPGACSYDKEGFREAWKNTLFNQFHDILPGSCIRTSREHAMGLFQQTMAVAGARLNLGLQALAGAVDTQAVTPAFAVPADSMSESGGAGFYTPFHCYTAASGSTGGEKRLFTVVNPSQADWCGPVELCVWDWAFTPNRAQVKDDRGDVLPAQLVDGAQQLYWNHKYFRILAHLAIPAFGYRTVVLEEKDEPIPVWLPPDPRVECRQVAYVLENEYLIARFDAATMMLTSLINKQTGREQLKTEEDLGGFYMIQEDDMEAMTAWRQGRHISRTPMTGNLRLWFYQPGPLRSKLGYEVEMGDSRIQLIISLDQGSRTLRYDVKCLWRELGHPGKAIPQLAFRLPLQETCQTCLCDVPYGCLERKPMEHDMPANSYALAPNGEGGLLLVTDSKYGYRCNGDTLSVTLIRSAYEPDNVPEVYDHEFSLGVGVADNRKPGTLQNISIRFCQPPLPLAVSRHEGSLPAAAQLLQVEGENVLVSAVKQAEEDDALIIRLAELAGSAGTATLRFGRKPVSAAYTDAHETSLADAVILSDGAVQVTMKPRKITTVKICFQEDVV